ncbi:MAG: hypothetical protein CXZ00_03085 [Acidobacteria bacterium]|nr:MAG: hypothetical protein CXZ00_03085 [Acidobacteriota bacterium]
MSDIIDSEQPASDDPRADLDFFGYMKSLTDAELNDRVIYIYRQEPAIRNPPGTGNYIEKVIPPIDEDYLKQHHGGGQYLLWLKTISDSKNDRKCVFRVDGPPKIPAGTTLLDGNTGAPIAPSAGAGNAAVASTENIVRDVLQSIIPLINKSTASPDEVLNTGMATMRKAMENAVDIMGSAAKKQSESATGNPLTDMLMKQALENLLHPPQRNPMEEFKVMLQTMREMQGLTGEAASPRRNGILDDLKGVAEILKSDTDGTIRNVLFGRDEHEPPSLGAGLLKIGEAILTRRPDIIDSAANLIARASSAVPPQTNHPAPVLTGVSPHEPAPVYPAAPAPKPQPTQEEQMIAGILQAIARGYNGGNTGDAVAISLQMIFPQEVAQFAQYLQLPDAMVMGWLRSQPAIAVIVNAPDFPEFYTDFKRQMLTPPEDPAEAVEPPEQAEAGEGDQ